jgi:ferrous iron transport protein B
MTNATLTSNSPSSQPQLNPDDILATAQSLRWEIGQDYHDRLMEAIYTDASRIADRAVSRPGEKGRFDMDRTIDRIVTSRVWGFPLMILLLAVVFWLTISGANVPSQMIANLLLDIVHPFLHAQAAAVGIPWWLSGFLWTAFTWPPPG